MFGDVLALPHQFEVFEPVVCLVAVDVMDNFVTFKKPAKVPLHDQAVFLNVSIMACMRVIPHQHKNVALLR